MAILITGSAGFVALNVAENLLAAGRDVIGLDRIALPDRARRGFAALPGRFTLIGGSILSAADLSRAMTIAPIEAVIHCAVITAGSHARKPIRDHRRGERPGRGGHHDGGGATRSFLASSIRVPARSMVLPRETCR